MFERLGRLAARRAAWVILVWFGLAAGLTLISPPLGSVLTFDETAFLHPEAESVRTQQRVLALWPDDSFGDAAAVVIERGERPLDGADFAYVAGLETWLHGPEAPEVVERTHSVASAPHLEGILTSPSGHATILLISFSEPPFEPPVNEAVAAIRAHIEASRPAGLATAITGEAGIGADHDAALRGSVRRTTFITLGLIIVILLAVYRSPVAPLVPLITIGTAFTVAQGVLALLAGAGVPISSLVETFMVVIVFGVGTDYCLFVISRFREGLAHVREFRPALVATVAVMGAVIASSAGTTVVGFMALGAARFGLFKTTGPAMAVTVVITMAAGLTLAPALMRIFGRALFWPAHPAPEGLLDAEATVHEPVVVATGPVSPPGGSARRRRPPPVAPEVVR